MNTEPTCWTSAGLAARVKQSDRRVPCTRTSPGAAASAFGTLPSRHATGTRCSSLPHPAAAMARSTTALQIAQLYAPPVDQRLGVFKDESTRSHGCEPKTRRPILHALRRAFEREQYARVPGVRARRDTRLRGGRPATRRGGVPHRD